MKTWYGINDQKHSYLEKIRSLIKAEMKRQRVTAWNLQKEHGIHSSDIWRFLNGPKPTWRTSFELVARICKALNLSIDETLRNV